MMIYIDAVALKTLKQMLYNEKPYCCYQYTNMVHKFTVGFLVNG